ncbi:MAG: FAD-binding oxidoreductase [Nitratireductor sp.]|nr:FAD-binding oxidoreductase [Nitratireductor sp.]
MPAGSGNARETIVIGAGIIGASIAWHLARGGASVTVIDNAAGGGATAASFAWINASIGNPREYFDLRMRSIEDWRRWARDLPVLGASMCGSLSFELSGDELEAYVREYGGWGYDIRLVGRTEIEALEPALRNPPQAAALVGDEGMVEPVHAANALLRDAGVKVLSGMSVRGIATTNGRITAVETENGIVEADAIVVAAGTGTQVLLASCGVDFAMKTPPGLLIHTKPLDRKLFDRLIISPDLHVRQRPDGSLLAGADFTGDFDPDRPQETIEMLAVKIRNLIGDDPAIEIAGFTVAERPTPMDGFPALGPVPGIEGLHVAVTHSGVTLAPVVGELLAANVLSGKTDRCLERYAIARFLEAGGAVPGRS